MAKDMYKAENRIVRTTQIRLEGLLLKVPKGLAVAVARNDICGVAAVTHGHIKWFIRVSFLEKFIAEALREIVNDWLELGDLGFGEELLDGASPHTVKVVVLRSKDGDLVPIMTDLTMRGKFTVADATYGPSIKSSCHLGLLRFLPLAA